MGGASLPTPSTPGYTSFRGFTSCECLAQWLPVYEALLLAKGLIKSNIDVWQLTGGAPASGGTHTQGGAFDLLYQTTPAHVAVAREMGAPGTWGRKASQGFSRDHLHGAIACGHSAPVAYQITAQKRGFNGLGQGYYNGQLLWGYGHKDEYPDPSVRRTWREGIAWAKSEIARLTPAPIVKEDDMANVSDAQLARLLDASDRILGAFPQRYSHKDGSVTFSKGTDGVPVRYADSADVGSVLNQLKGENANLKAQLGGVTSTVAALAKGQVLTADQILDAARAGATAALDAKITNADVNVNLNVAPQA